MQIERKFNPGTFKVGQKHVGIVISDKPNLSKRKGSGHDDKRYYGGFLVCESIVDKATAQAIAAIPQMVDALEATMTYLETEGKADTLLGIQIKNTIKLLE